ncbi:hypothetical protein C4D60_Mb08t18430 [Musa balbisiana]|uniref:Uncharacterized protein n=1 Tax=Musa balbisiana TaxID=52838 RepID=A0A4S8K4R2_MUSBA|nr:hypothetical protein C4D60_Mb08t18430 [Musa balbisiana]
MTSKHSFKFSRRELKTHRLRLLVATSYSPLPFSSSDSRPRDLRSVVAALLCGSPLERRTLDLLHPLLQICRDLRIYDLPRLYTKAEEKAKNIISKWTVIKCVLLQQAI